MPLQFKANVAFVNRALAQVDHEMQRRARGEIQAIGGLVEHQAEALGLSRIRNMPRSPEWAGMRVGQTSRLVYVAPQQRGSKRRGSDKRHNLADLLYDRAMFPAKKTNEPEIVRRFNRLTAEVCAKFNH